MTFDLRKPTGRCAWNAQALVSDPLTEAEQEVLGKTRQLISTPPSQGTALKNAVKDEEVDEILGCIWVPAVRP